MPLEPIMIKAAFITSSNPFNLNTTNEIKSKQKLNTASLKVYFSLYPSLISVNESKKILT